MLRLSFSLTSLLILLGLLLPQTSATLGGMSLPDDGISGAPQALEHQAQSPNAEPQLDQGSPEQIDQHSGAQLEPRQGHKTATCEVFPLLPHWTVIIDFMNWDPAKDGKAEDFERRLQEKCGKENLVDFWWKKFPNKTKFVFHVPYDRMKVDMYKLFSAAIFEYSGDAKIHTECYHA